MTQSSVRLLKRDPEAPFVLWVDDGYSKSDLLAVEQEAVVPQLRGRPSAIATPVSRSLHRFLFDRYQPPVHSF